MIHGEIKDVKDNNTFVVEFESLEKLNQNIPNHTEIKIAHDYVEFEAVTLLATDYKSGINIFDLPSAYAANQLGVRASVQISIRDFKNFFLPMLLESEFMQNDHLKDRIHDDDDPYWKDKGLDGPRYKKGDSYKAYAYNAAVIYYYDQVNKVQMVAFRKRGESAYSRVSIDVWNMIKNDIDLYNYDE